MNICIQKEESSNESEDYLTYGSQTLESLEVVLATWYITNIYVSKVYVINVIQYFIQKIEKYMLYFKKNS